ncbi:CDP-glycerol glycerophosphotransferase family protein [Hoeflea olei]|uniref:UDP-N-acetylglucosamine 2-epimerase domain-containing protein n=1 Tax=Hoeflea olei TaxID=1480615 RepID=A0A1C1YU15_9HYPH|nr:CDP-glycerol glycerophosphotransferase family protein [Hoeflea olei]OCW56994.1 hypothetical protein AWJ14_07515 [Hoeflea olei]
MPERTPRLFLSFNDTPEVNTTLRVTTERISSRLEVLAEHSGAVTSSELDDERGRSEFEIYKSKIPLNESYCDILLRQKAACRKLLLENAIDTVIVCEDGPGGCAALIAVAQELGILVVEMPFGIGEMRDYRMHIENRAAEKTLNLVPDDPTGKALRKYAPKWILPTEYGPITLFPAEFVLARIAVGLDLPEPWVVHGGSADALLVESEAMERIYRRENVPARKLIMTGSCYADAVYDETASDPALMKAYETASLIDAEKPRILIALPPSYHRERKAEFATYQETLERLLKGCRAAHPNAHITVSVHPAADQATRQTVADLADGVSDDWLLRLIARTDVFVTVVSSTIRWALMAKKPVLNYDMYRFDQPTYDTAPAVFTTPELNQALQRLGDILATPESYHRAAMEVSACSGEWGMMDGRNFVRLWQTLQDLRQRHAERATKPGKSSQQRSIAQRVLSLFRKTQD